MVTIISGIASFCFYFGISRKNKITFISLLPTNLPCFENMAGLGHYTPIMNRNRTLTGFKTLLEFLRKAVEVENAAATLLWVGLFTL
jgi:hypothetical protein